MNTTPDSPILPSPAAKKTKSKPSPRECADAVAALGPKSAAAIERLRREGRCEICGAKPTKARLDRDHHHVSKRHRGLLCRRCNLVLGKVHDDVRILEAMIKYLNKDPVPGDDDMCFKDE
jgi:hypothetical protein